MPWATDLRHVKHEAKIPQLAHTISAEEDVFRLDIHVHQRVLMEMVDSLKELKMLTMKLYKWNALQANKKN